MSPAPAVTECPPPGARCIRHTAAHRGKREEGTLAAAAPLAITSHFPQLLRQFNERKTTGARA
jgi:hypothetical protein